MALTIRYYVYTDGRPGLRSPCLALGKVATMLEPRDFANARRLIVRPDGVSSTLRRDG